MRRSPFAFILLWLSLGMAMLACNLSSSSAPPTLVPRPSATPPPTIGYATLAPDELPDIIETAAPQDPTRGNAFVLNLLEQVDTERLMTHVQTLQNMGTRHVNSTQNAPNQGIGAAFNYIYNQFLIVRDESNGNFVVPDAHAFSLDFAGVTTSQRNIIGVINGQETGGGILLLGAHYDSVSIDWQDGNALAPGANDNGSGVAALIEIARIMSTRPQRATVIFVAFAAEESNREGSIAFVDEYLVSNQIQVDWMLNMDIIGSSTGPNGSINDDEIRVFSAEPNESPSRQLARSLQLIVQRHVPVMRVRVEPTGDREGRYSDHLSFSDEGFAAVRFIEAEEDGNRQHTNQDTMDDIQPEYLRRSTQTILASAAALGGGPRPPRSISLRDEGGGLRTLVWEPSEDAVDYIVAVRRPTSLIYDYTFPVDATSITWDRFIPTEFAGVAIAARDSNGLLGPFSFEYGITN